MTTAAAILAGGRGQRLGGVDKALVEIGGRPLLERQLDVLRPLVDDVVVVTDVPARYARFTCRPIADLHPGHGPLAGIEAALAATTVETLLVFGCDLPFLDPALVALLRDHAPAAQAVMPRIAGRPQPLHARYARSIAPLVRERLVRGQLRLLDLVAELEVAFLDEALLRTIDPELRGLLNVNTPEELARAQLVPVR